MAEQMPELLPPSADPPAAPAAPNGPGGPERTHAARRAARHAPLVLGGALAVGVVADLLLRATPWGVNVPITVLALLGALAWLARRMRRTLSAGAVLLALVAALFAACIAWRDAGPLVLLNLLASGAALAALAAAVWHGDALAIERAGPRDYVVGAWRTGWAMVVGTPRLAHAAHATPRPALHRALRSDAATVARGALLALPALVGFGLLLAAADGTFARLAERAVDWDVEAMGSHVALTLLCAWAVGGYLWRALLAPAARDATDAAPTPADGPPMVGPGEVCVALVLVDLLFLVFGVLQLGWLFGGDAVLARAGVTVAEYARRGFFELVTVAALALPMLVAAHARVAPTLGRADGVRRQRIFRLAAGALVALVLVLLVSALDRMRLYRAAFGLTEARLYATALLVWLGVVFAWAAATLLRGRGAPFALGTLVAAWAGVLALDVANPAARIVATNVARAEAGRPLDVRYLLGLGADAVPALAARALPLAVTRSDTVAVCGIARALHRAGAAHGDWRGANVGRVRAALVVATRRAEIERTLAECATATATPHAPGAPPPRPTEPYP